MRINISLSKSNSIQNAIGELKKYKQSLRNKQEVFMAELAKIGVPIIDAQIAVAGGDADKSHLTYIKVASFGDYSQATLTVEGKDIVLFEFGAGVHFNGVGSPRDSEIGNQNGIHFEMLGGEELGLTIGSYGKGQGLNDYWYYVADTGESRRSQGTEATMPLYHASREIIERILEVARSVYGK